MKLKITLILAISVLFMFLFIGCDNVEDDNGDINIETSTMETSEGAIDDIVPTDETTTEGTTGPVGNNDDITASINNQNQNKAGNSAQTSR